MSYVDGYLVPVQRDKLAEYWDMARIARDVWLEHGALSYTECVADDVAVGKLTSFPRALLLTDDEVVVYSWITFHSREHRDVVNEKAMNDARFAGYAEKPMPFDGKRMIFGGFKVMVG